MGLTEDAVPYVGCDRIRRRRIKSKILPVIMIAYDVGEDDGTEPSAEWFLRNSYCIWRFMIDRRYQGRGYGRKALELALEFIRTFPAGPAQYCWLDYEPENEVARKLYLSFGFVERPEQYDEEEGGEIPAVLEL